MKGFDGVGAGEDKPVEALELRQSGIERGIAFGWNDLDGGNKDGGRAEGLEPRSQVGCLTPGAGDEDAFVLKDEHLCRDCRWREEMFLTALQRAGFRAGDCAQSHSIYSRNMTKLSKVDLVGVGLNATDTVISAGQLPGTGFEG